MKFTKKQFIIIGGGVLLLILIYVAITFGARPASQSAKVTLTVWGTDPNSVFQDLAGTYKTADPGATINYTQIDPANYQSKLLNAFAAGTGPDIFEITNRELPQWESVSAPIPATLANTFNLTTLEADFPTVVEQDFTSGGQVYGLPLDLDTLVLFYNKDIFDSAGIVYPPKTWDDFQADVAKLRMLNAQGQITQSGAAIGGSEASMPNANDLVFLLMLQNGTKMTSSDGTTATFNSGVTGGSNPGLSAFNFYLQFSSSNSSNYTWNDGLGDATQNFVAGKTAMMFGYASDIAKIKQTAPFLNFAVAPMPQPANATIAVNYPSYKGLVVAKQGQVASAWPFVIFVTTNTGAEASYIKDTGEPPATRAYIAANLNDPNYGVFASQALTARSWPEANDAQIDSIMNNAIVSVLNGSSDSARALGIAQDAVTTVMQNQ